MKFEVFNLYFVYSLAFLRHDLMFTRADSDNHQEHKSFNI